MVDALWMDAMMGYKCMTGMIEDQKMNGDVKSHPQS